MDSRVGKYADSHFVEETASFRVVSKYVEVPWCGGLFLSTILGLSPLV